MPDDNDKNKGGKGVGERQGAQGEAGQGDQGGQGGQGGINPVQVQKFLSGMDYPAKKQDLIQKAQSEGADQNVIDALNKLPDQEFQTPADVSQAIGETE